MIYLITGLPGAAKTLNTIKDVYEKHTEEGCSNPQQVYVYGIKGLNVPEWIQIESIEELKGWWDFPSGSVFIVDEVQDVWPTRPSSRPMPDEVKKFAQNRHKGFDLYFTCQNTKQIDVGIKDVTSYHIHYYRPFGLSLSHRYYYEGVVSNPISKSNTQFAQTETRKFDKKYFDFYKSAEVHTVKRKLPKVVYIFLVVLVFLALAIWNFYSRFSSPPDAVLSSTSDASSGTDARASFYPAKVDDDFDFVKLSVPRYNSLPSSAPLYDSLNSEVKSKPRLQFVSHEKDGKRFCVAYTQQATKVALSNDDCLFYMKSGRSFDATLPDRALEKNERLKASAPQSPLFSNDSVQAISSSYPIYSGERPTFETSENSYKGIF